MLMKMRSNRSSHSLMVGIQKGTDGGNTEWYRWWEYGIRKGADGGNMEWYRWWEYRKVQMVGIQNGTVKLEHSWAVSHKAEPNLPSNLTTVSPGTQPNELNVCSHKTRR